MTLTIYTEFQLNMSSLMSCVDCNLKTLQISLLFKGTQPLIFLLSYPEQFGSLINVRYKRNLKVEYFIFKKTFSKNPKVPLPLKNWLPEQNMALKTWLPEQNMALKYGRCSSETRGPYTYF